MALRFVGDSGDCRAATRRASSKPPCVSTARAVVEGIQRQSVSNSTVSLKSRRSQEADGVRFTTHTATDLRSSADENRSVFSEAWPQGLRSTAWWIRWRTRGVTATYFRRELVTPRADQPLTDGGPSGRPEKEEVPAPRLENASKATCTKISGEAAPGRDRWKHITPLEGEVPARTAATTLGCSRSASVGGRKGGSISPSSSASGSEWGAAKNGGRVTHRLR